MWIYHDLRLNLTVYKKILIHFIFHEISYAYFIYFKSRLRNISIDFRRLILNEKKHVI